MLPEALKANLLQSAREVLRNAYAPYSRYRVGAALLTQRGAIFTGCNVENASYGLSLCAERAAVCAALAAEGPEMRIRALALATDPEAPGAPCGACRQVIREFGPEATVIFPGADGLREMPLAELLPLGFELPSS
jgi:cytidine deaminase